MRLLARLTLPAIAWLACSTVSAQETASTGTQIYLQRTPDGRAVLSDRPVAGTTTQRTWQIEREDQASAQQRHDEMRREAEAVSERIGRQLERERQRDEAFAREQYRLAQAQAERDAERARAEAAREPVVLISQRAMPRFVPHRPPRQLPPHTPRRNPLQPRMQRVPETQ